MVLEPKKTCVYCASNSTELSLIFYLVAATTNPPLIADLSFSGALVPLQLKLDKENHAFWRSLILPSVRAHDLEGFLVGTRLCRPQYITLQQGEGSSSPMTLIQLRTISPTQHLNPEYVLQMRIDQILMGLLLDLIFESMLDHVVRCTSFRQLWITLE